MVGEKNKTLGANIVTEFYLTKIDLTNIVDIVPLLNTKKELIKSDSEYSKKISISDNKVFNTLFDDILNLYDEEKEVPKNFKDAVIGSLKWSIYDDPLD